jgi:signal peptidase
MTADLGHSRARTVRRSITFSPARAAHLLIQVLLATAIGLLVVVLLIGRLVPLTGRQTLVIASGSMSPTIPAGAAVILGPADPATLINADVVAFHVGSNGAVVTHRVTRIIDRHGQLWLETRGDANPSVDPALTPASSIIGRVEHSIPLAGYVLKFLSVPAGVGSVLSLVALLLTVDSFLDPTSPVRPSPKPAVSHAGERSGLRRTQS